MEGTKKGTFEMNGHEYEADLETINTIKGLVAEARRTKDFTAILALMFAGIETGRIIEMIRTDETLADLYDITDRTPAGYGPQETK